MSEQDWDRWLSLIHICSVMYDDEPKKVFHHVKELEAVGLAAPQVTYIMHTLKDAGLAVETDATKMCIRDSPYFGGFVSNLPGEHSVKKANHRKAHPARFYALTGLGRKQEARKEKELAAAWGAEMAWLYLIEEDGGKMCIRDRCLSAVVYIY